MRRTKRKLCTCKSNNNNRFKILKLFSYTIKAYLKKILLAELQTVKMLYDETLILLMNTSLNFILKNNSLQTTLMFYN